jgi:flagellar hook assembly protein FlgD
VQGEPISVKYSARNVSDVDMDSLLVEYRVQLADRRTIVVGQKRFGPIAAGQVQTHDFSFYTDHPDMLGEMNFIIELNPSNDQPEQYLFNNVFAYPFKVLPDKINPILDVTVDGKHLMDNDIVSPNPDILIQINDENQFLAVPDTAYVIHFGLKTPNPANLPRVFINGNPEINLEFAQLPENKAKLTFRPGQLADGTYTLRVQGRDYAGNDAGKNAYEIDFKVVNEVALSNVVNYPNPFSSSTRFVYTLTGGEVPERFEIQIFTITGKLVKVIDLHASNDVKVGYTMTNYAWDGRDEFGDPLANGVYLYKVVAKVNGQDMKLRDEGITDLFKNGFGKMYLMR